MPFAQTPDRGAGTRGRWLWPLLYAATIVAMSHRSTVPGPSWLGFDKVVHFCAYGLLATAVCRLGRGWAAAGWALVVTAAFGATDEWHQSFVPGRAMDFADWVADTLGAALAVTLYTAWPAYRRLLERPCGVMRLASAPPAGAAKPVSPAARGTTTTPAGPG